jgi:signal transduction histidine kinase
VQNDGPGTPSTLPTTRAAPGQTHGLGLSIVRSLGEHLGASLEVVPNEPRGLVFRVTLPPRV